MLVSELKPLSRLGGEGDSGVSPSGERGSEPQARAAQSAAPLSKTC